MKERIKAKDRVWTPPQGDWTVWLEIKWRWFRFTKGCDLILRGIFR